MVRLSTGKLALLAGIIGFGIFIGVDASSKGVESVHGTGPDAVRTGQTAASGAAQSAGSSKQQTAAGGGVSVQSGSSSEGQGKLGPASRPGQLGQTAAAAQPPSANKATASPVKGGQASAKVIPADTIQESFINRLSNSIGDALQMGAKLIMKGVVSIFDAIVG